MTYRNLRVALIVPCFNEEIAIAQVIRGFREAMPCIEIFIFDNNSRDSTPVVARAEKAHVVTVTSRGKGNVVRRMFADVNADIFVKVPYGL